MSHIEFKALQLREEAQRRVKSAGFLQNLFSRSTNKTEESIEYYKRAGNLFKMVKKWKQAGSAFMDAANLCYKAKNFTEAALEYIEAANCYKNCDTEMAIKAYKEAVKLYRNNGKYSAVAKNYEAMSELLQEDYNNQEAEKYLEQAAYFYQLDKRYWASNKCLEQIAEGAALASDYVKAIKIFEGIACFELSSSTRKHVANEYFFRCAICVLCAGASVTKRLLTYIYIFPPFKMSREYELVVCLAECINDNDLEGFEYAVRIFDSQTELSQWHVTLLLRARNQITEKEHLIL
ncbi:alpha-soluble NSF attachment protein-like [Diabrotica undecimpunctata]|uniref:alpha-soluble NSF attachment protein-like n=1 Tax=Diabrotica undecimpunctata TaxID=50387 RepID=UPI003B6411EC